MHADLRGACASFLPKMAIDCHDYPGVAEASALANHDGCAMMGAISLGRRTRSDEAQRADPLPRLKTFVGRCCTWLAVSRRKSSSL